MQRRILPSLLLAFLLAFSFAATAQEHGSENNSEHAVKGSEHESAETKEFINHHVLDSYEFNITEGVGFPLPVILIDNGLHVFMASKFHHGVEAYESKGKKFMAYRSKIYSIADGVHLDEKKVIQIENKKGKLIDSTYYERVATYTFDEFSSKYLAGHSKLPENTIVSSPKPFDISITKNVFTIIFMAIFMFWVFGGIAKTYKKGPIPTGAGRFLEPIIIFIRDEVAIPNIGEKHYKKYMSYLLTVFFFIWFLNLFGMFPFGVNVTGNIAITFGLAIITFFITQFTAKKTYWLHVFWMPGVPVIMKIVLAPIELLGVFIKPFALMIRLYANMKAGHVVLMSLIAVMYTFSNWGAKGAFVGLTLMLSVIELLVAALQAYIFTILSALYFGAASEEHGEH